MTLPIREIITRLRALFDRVANDDDTAWLFRMQRANPDIPAPRWREFLEANGDEPVTVCADTGLVMFVNTARYADGIGDISPEAYRESYTTCARCADVVHHSNTQEVGGERWCDDCADNHSFVCEYCDEQEPERVANHIHGGGTICDNCIDNADVVRCVDCETLVRRDDAYETAHEDHICPNCAATSRWRYDAVAECYDRRLPAHSRPDDLSDPRGERRKLDHRYHRLLEYSTSPLSVGLTPYQQLATEPPQSIRKGLWFGIEIEVERRGNCPSDIHARVAHDIVDLGIMARDGSLSVDGFEIKSVPGSLLWHRQAWDRFFDRSAKYLRSWGTNTCGMHIHINSGAMTRMVLGKMMVFINSPANRDFINRVAGRNISEETYCLATNDESVAGAAYSEPSRHVAFNPSTRKGTCELRIFRGNIAREGFLRNLDFAAAVVAFCGETATNKLAVADFTAWMARPENRAFYEYHARWLKAKGYIDYKSKALDENYDIASAA